MTHIVIIAAMPGELKPLVKGWRHERRGSIHLWRSSRGETEITAACTGAGQDCARRAFAAAESFGTITAAISYGWVGALSEACEVGKAWNCAGVIDLRTGERFACENPQDHDKKWLVTSPRVADEAEKRRLTLSYNAHLVDMEAAAIARLADQRQIPFFCIKGVSDGANDRLPDFNRFLGADGQMKMGKLIVFALLHPSCWSALARMGENSRRAAAAMAVAVREIAGLTGAMENG